VKPLKLENAPALAALVFDNVPGEEFLAHLRAVYYDKQVYRPGMDPLEVVFHDGQRNLVAYLIAAVAQGKAGVKPPTRTNLKEDDNA
jgi:hypothetical protein